MTETVEKTANGAVLYDKAIISRISEDRFTPGGWLHAEPLPGTLGSGGRGATMFVGNVPRQFVLRHYRRGGLIGRLVYDSYLWAGEDRTRSFREWRLLEKLVARGLRVPRPAAARYRRLGPLYTADLITVTIPGARPLSAVIASDRRPHTFWRAVGAEIAAFHRAGVCHADMNAHNLQIDGADRLWMLDFDRGRLRQPGSWQQKTLGRLHRSLVKLKTREPRLNFAAGDWEALLAGYFDSARSA